MLLLQVQNVARRFGADYLFQNIQMEIQDHARVALVGPNGIGKSTLLKIIADINPPDQGQVTLGKGVTLAYLPQDSGLDSQRNIYAEMLTLFEPLQKMEQHMHQLEQALGDPKLLADQAAYQATLKQYDQLQHDFTEQNGYGYEAEIRGVLHGFKFDESTYAEPISNLSGGEKSRLALAKLLLAKNDLIILDEPTNHLDIDTLAWLENYLQGYPGAILLVSHDRYFLDHAVNEIYDLTPAAAVHYRGNYTAFLAEKKQRAELQWKAYEKQQTEITKLQDYVDKNIVRASTTKMAQSRRKQLEKMVRLARPQTQEQHIHFQFTPHSETGNEVLQVTNATIGYDPQEPMAQPVNLNVKKHDVQAIVGPNGVGKSTLLKSILGQIPLLAGTVKLGTNVEIGYYDQEQQQLHANKTVLQELWDDHPTTPEKEIRALLASFLFRGDDVLKTVADLSGGQKARLELTKLAMNHDNFLILDEPTNHLDIESRAVLETAIQEFTGTVLFISHDRYFINQVATSINEISPEGSTYFMGDWDYYQEKKTEAAEMAAVVAAENQTETEIPTNQAQLNYADSKTQQKQERKIEREVASLEKQMEQVEAEIKTIEQQMTLEINYTDAEKTQTLQGQLAKAQTHLATFEDQWEEQSLALEDLRDNNA